jgi:nucleoid-associated protein YgaU
MTETTVAVQLRNRPDTRTAPVVVVVPIVVTQEEVTGVVGADATDTGQDTAAAAAPSEYTVGDAAADSDAGGDGQSYVVQPGDTLTTLAQEYLGDQARYREIVAATNEKAATDPAIDAITNPDVITVGQTIWIPAE